MREEVRFHIDCGWVCDFVRQRVYYEGLPYEDGLKLLKEMFSCTDEIAVQILTGIKRVEGIDQGELVDDNKSAEFSAFLARQRRGSLRKELQIDMRGNPWRYFDRYAANADDVRQFELLIARGSVVPTLDEIEQFFRERFGGDPEHSFLVSGLWSLHEPVGKKPIRSDEDQDEYYEELYKYLQSRLEDIKDATVREEIAIRQKNYERRGAKYSAGKGFQIPKNGEYDFFDGGEFYVIRETAAKYVPKPEGEFTKWGLISPQGDFYACDFASHAAASATLAIQLGYIKIPENDSRLLYGDLCDDYGPEAKEILYERGWVFVNINGAPRTFYSKWGEIEDMPQKQMDTCYDYRIWQRRLTNN